MRELAKEVREKISALRLALAKRLGKHRFELWFGPENSLEIVNGTVRVGLPSLLFQKWVAQQFRDDILAVCSEVLGFTPQLEFLTVEGPPLAQSENCGKISASQYACNNNIGPNGPNGSPHDPHFIHNPPPESPLPTSSTQSHPCLPSRVAEADSSLEEGGLFRPADELARASETSSPTGKVRPICQAEGLDSDHPGCTDAVSQEPDFAESNPPSESSGIPRSTDPPGFENTSVLFPELLVPKIDGQPGRKTRRRLGTETVSSKSSGSLSPRGELPRRRVLTFADFVVGPCNRLGYAAALEVCRRPGDISPLFLHGPTSVGKTHLLQAICEEVRRRHPGLVAISMSADEFITSSVEALRHGGLPSFRNKFRHVDVLGLDDIQLLIGKKWVQRELVLTIDSLLREGKQLILASDRPPEGLIDFGEDFVARIKSGMICALDWPDRETRQQIVRCLCQRLRFEMPAEVCDYLAFHVAGHARELLGAIRRLQAVALTSGQAVTLQMAEQALEDLVSVHRRPIRLNDVCQAVCEVFGTPTEQLSGPGRSQAVSQPRLLAMWLARKYTRAGLSEISRFFGRRSHTAVLAAQRTVEKWLAEGRTLRVYDRQVGVADVIRQLERRLQAG